MKEHFSKEGVDIISELTKERNRCEEKVIHQVLEEYLDRTPMEADYHMCSRRFSKGITDKYVLMYKQEILGRVEYKIDGIEFHVIFNPV